MRTLLARLLALAAGLLVFSAGCSKEPAAPKPVPAAPVFATIETDFGPIEVELLPDAAPKTVENFRLLAQRGYYAGCTFMRIVKGFMVQTGDPTNSGKGGESAWGGKFDDEIDRTSPLYRGGYKRGTVAMANAGPNTNTSQFFIVQKDYPLNPGYTIFGKVTRGMEVVDQMVDVPMTRGFDFANSKPVTPIAIKRVSIHNASGEPALVPDPKK